MILWFRTDTVKLCHIECRFDEREIEHPENVATTVDLHGTYFSVMIDSAYCIAIVIMEDAGTVPEVVRLDQRRMLDFFDRIVDCPQVKSTEVNVVIAVMREVGHDDATHVDAARTLLQHTQMLIVPHSTDEDAEREQVLERQEAEARTNALLARSRALERGDWWLDEGLCKGIDSCYPAGPLFHPCILSWSGRQG